MTTKWLAFSACWSTAGGRWPPKLLMKLKKVMSSRVMTWILVTVVPMVVEATGAVERVLIAVEETGVESVVRADVGVEIAFAPLLATLPVVIEGLTGRLAVV
jgi:hypothetical protein